MVLLLHVGNDVEDGVDVVRGGSHGQAGGAASRAVDQEVVLRQCHVHPREHKCNCGDCDWDGVASVKAAEGGNGGFAHTTPELVSNWYVDW